MLHRGGERRPPRRLAELLSVPSTTSTTRAFDCVWLTARGSL